MESPRASPISPAGSLSSLSSNDHDSFIILDQTPSMMTTPNPLFELPDEEATDYTPSHETMELEYAKAENLKLRDCIRENAELTRKQVEAVLAWKEEKEKCIGSYKDALEAFKDKTKEMAGHNEQLLKQIDTLSMIKEEKEALQKENVSLHERYQDEIHSLNEENDHLDIENSKLKDHLKALKDENILIFKEKIALEEEVRLLKTIADELRDQVAKMSQLREGTMIVEDTNDFTVIHHPGKITPMLTSNEDMLIQSPLEVELVEEKIKSSQLFQQMLEASLELQKIKKEADLHNTIPKEIQDDFKEESHPSNETTKRNFEELLKKYAELQEEINLFNIEKERENQERVAMYEARDRNHQESVDKLIAKLLAKDQDMETLKDQLALQLKTKFDFDERINRAEKEEEELSRLRTEFQRIQDELEAEKNKKAQAEKEVTTLQELVDTIIRQTAPISNDSTSETSRNYDWEEIRAPPQPLVPDNACPQCNLQFTTQQALINHVNDCITDDPFVL